MIPDPLHPAIVHFPIVLLVLGAPLAVASIFIRKWHLPFLTMTVLLLGAVGSVVASYTGEEAAELAGDLSGPAEEILDEHEEWGERTRNVGIVAAGLAILSVMLLKVPMAGKIFGLATALGAVLAAFFVVQAGHYGGEAVYKHGIGVNLSASSPSTEAQGGTKTHHGGTENDEDQD